MVDVFAPRVHIRHLPHDTGRRANSAFSELQVHVARAIRDGTRRSHYSKVAYSFASILLATLCIIERFTTDWERGTTGYG